MSNNTKLSIENMNLHYGSFHALKDINMHIPEKEITAFIGPSGCGKSTLLKLLANYYEDYEGEILIGKQELRTIDRKSLSRKMAMIHQNVFLFEDTLRANITMFQEYPDEEIKEFELYIVAEENAAYYVVNGIPSDDYKIVL